MSRTTAAHVIDRRSNGVTVGRPTVPASSADLDRRLDAAMRARAADPERALRLATPLAEQARTLGDNRALARALRIIAGAHLVLSNYPEASCTATEACALYRELGDLAGQASLLSTLATVRRRTGDNAGARELLADSLERAQRSGDQGAVATALNGFGNLGRSTGEYELSLALHRAACDAAAASGDADEECSALQGIGSSLERLARYHEALDVYREALALAERIDHPRMISYAAGNIGTILERLGRMSEALEYERRSLAMKERAGDRWGLGVSYNNLGILYRYHGEYASAIEAHVTSLRMTRAIGDREGESVALNCIGQLYEELGSMTRVFECYSASLAIAKEIGYRQGEAYSLGHIGRFYLHLGDIPRALMHYFRTLRMAEASGERYLVRSALVSIGRAYEKLGDRTRAEEYLQRSLDEARATGDRLGEASSLSALGELFAHGGGDEGIERLAEALAIAEELDNRDQMRTVLLALADAYRQREDEEEARRYRARYRRCTEEIFNEESSRRVRELLIGFEGDTRRQQALELGLDEGDLELITAAVQRDVTARAGVPPSAMPGGAVHEITMHDTAGHVDGQNAGHTNGHTNARADDAAGESNRGTIARARAAVHADGAESAIVVRTFGEFGVSIGGQELGTGEWKRKRARDLFKLLLINHRRALTVDEIIETLWEGRADRKSEMLVMNAISHIRSALEPGRRRGSPSRYLVGTDRSYSLHLGECMWIDFLQFKELIVSARRVSSARERRELYERAVELYRGDFLKEDYYEPWTASERDLLKDAFLEASEFLAVDYQRSAEHDAAIDVSRRILAHDSTSERAYEVLVAALIARGRPSEARRVIEECRQAYLRELDEEPPVKITALLNVR